MATVAAATRTNTARIALLLMALIVPPRSVSSGRDPGVGLRELRTSQPADKPNSVLPPRAPATADEPLRICRAYTPPHPADMQNSVLPPPVRATADKPLRTCPPRRNAREGETIIPLG